MKQIPNRPKTSKLSKAYELIPDPNDEQQWLVRLLKEPWKGIVYKYLTFSLKEDATNDRLITKFDYDIIKEMLPPKFVGKQFTDEEGKDFNTLIGDIVIELLEEHLNSTKE